MAHDHHHPQNYNNAFAVGVALNLAFVAIEGTYGFLADLLAWGDVVLASFESAPRRTYGYRRVTILAALLSALLSWASSFSAP